MTDGTTQYEGVFWPDRMHRLAEFTELVHGGAVRLEGSSNQLLGELLTFSSKPHGCHTRTGIALAAHWHRSVVARTIRFTSVTSWEQVWPWFQSMETVQAAEARRERESRRVHSRHRRHDQHRATLAAAS